MLTSGWEGRAGLLVSPASFAARLLPSIGLDDGAAMELALEEARLAAAAGEVPVGAVVLRGGVVVGRGHNRRESWGDPLAHAEMIAMAVAAAGQEGWRLDGCSVYVTLEPCAMCVGAMVNARVDRLVFGAHDPRAGFCGSLGNLADDPRLNHRIAVCSGVRAEEGAELLRSFFRRLRQAAGRTGVGTNEER